MHRTRATLPLPRPRRHWLFSVLAALAIAAQLVVAIAPLSEGRDSRMASHVEAHGLASHYAHNEATCAACQARSIHGTAPHTQVAAAIITVSLPVLDASARRGASPEHYPQDNPRAPPSVI